MTEHTFDNEGAGPLPAFAVQAVVLHRLLGAPNDGLGRRELYRALIGPRAERAAREQLERALYDLLRAGLIDEHAGRLRATSAARRFHRLMLSGEP